VDTDIKMNEEAKVVLTLKEYASEVMRAYVEGFNAAKAVLDASDIGKMDLAKAFEDAYLNKNKKEDLSDMAIKSQNRPDNFRDLTAEEQWEIDKQLGILDWDGK
jgi:uncharacterized protein (UPF0332 family)